MKIKKMFSDFCKNIKEYIKIIVQLNLKDLFLYTLALILLIVIAGLVYLPIGLIKEIIISFIIIFVHMSDFAFNLFDWLFLLIQSVAFVFVFVYIFNTRYEKISFEDISKDEIKKKEKKEDKNTDDEVVLPKVKKN